MAINATQSSAPRELIPAGNYIARCYEMIEIGTINEVINGDAKQLKKVMIGWEFPNDKKVFNPEKGEQPYVFSQEYTLSLGEKANLRKMLASWRGKDFTPEEAKCFDITKLLGVTAMVNIIHAQSQKGSTYAKIGSVSAVPKGIPVPEQINPTLRLEYDNFDYNIFNNLPEFIRDKMRGSLEFAALSITPSHPTGNVTPARDTRGNVTGYNNNYESVASETPADIDSLPF